MSETQDMTYGQAAERLDHILRSIEGGQADIDELSKLVDEAAGLVTLCRDKIEAAEVQVTKIAADLTREAVPPQPSFSEAPPLTDADAPPLDDDDVPF
jgi:exodeoxyribonuclease VII small subunit